MMLSVILVHYRDVEKIKNLLKSLPAYLRQYEYEIVVVENGSGLEGLEQVFKSVNPDINFIQSQENLGFARGVNLGVENSSGDVLVVLNPDVELKDNFFEPLINKLISNENIALVGPSVVREGGKQQLTAHKRFPNLWTEFIEFCLPIQFLISNLFSTWHPHDESIEAHKTTHQTAHLTGVCMVMRRSDFDALGGLDSRYFLYLEETDFQKRIQQAGKQIWYVAESKCIHYGSIDKGFTQGSPFFLESLKQYWLKWEGDRSLTLLRLSIFFAALISFLALILISPLALFSENINKKVGDFLPGYGRILGWVSGQ